MKINAAGAARPETIYRWLTCINYGSKQNCWTEIGSSTSGQQHSWELMLEGAGEGVLDNSIGPTSSP